MPISSQRFRIFRLALLATIVAQAGECLGVALSSQTTDDSERIGKFFEDAADKLSLNSSARSSMNLNGATTLKLTFKSGKRELVVFAFGKSGDPLVIQTTYGETK